jgi:hypothetical protein
VNGDDERDYAEEADVRAEAVREGLAEQAAERFDYGPLQTFELTWTGGHVERIQAHQVAYPGNAAILFGHEPNAEPVIEFHGDFDGRWRLVLRVHAKEIRIIRNLSVTEPEVLG